MADEDGRGADSASNVTLVSVSLSENRLVLVEPVSVSWLLVRVGPVMFDPPAATIAARASATAACTSGSAKASSNVWSKTMEPSTRPTIRVAKVSTRCVVVVGAS